MNIVAVRFDHPDARKLNDLVQAEYRERYRDPDGDATPLDATMFDPPNGLYLLAYDPQGRPVASGGWRRQEANDEGYRDGDAEIKRMYVVPEARGQGLARRILALLEEDARRAGRRRMVLETGTRQPEAVALYESSGYRRVPREEMFGIYRHDDVSLGYVKPLAG
ncbi:GNAT family N-acetyltransferase [Streptomyces sp. 7-21]|uniref:GNAT family N-acetyltransferase n=1 Tax=Streptomyces sp. 7-21 TaxID=2802283 RepID=UPI0019202981|nr:GNAT family N-acetyltransferase [Streptomyces sp. 7-21]MBL1068690.1 GNAT family N-acetyltransferase [Streptomyces sp. 7-21]